MHALASVVHASVWRIGLLRNLHVFGTTSLRCCISLSLASTPRLRASCCHLTRPKTVYGLSSCFPFSTFWEAHDCIFDSRQANAQRMQMRACFCLALGLTLPGCIQVHVFGHVCFGLRLSTIMKSGNLTSHSARLQTLSLDDDDDDTYATLCSVCLLLDSLQYLP